MNKIHNYPIIHSSQRILRSKRGDIFILISVAISVVIFSYVAGYQLLLANKAKSNLLTTESTDGFLMNEINAWSGYFRKKAGLSDLVPVTNSSPDADNIIIEGGGAGLVGGGILIATGKSSASSDGVNFCGRSTGGNAVCIRGPSGGGVSPATSTVITGLSCDEFITNYAGSVSGAIQIRTEEEFSAMHSGGVYELANNIDFEGTDPNLNTLENFYFDGKNFRLKNITIGHKVGSLTANQLGLFLKLKNGILRNVAFDNLKIQGQDGFVYKNVGSIAAVTQGAVCFDKVGIVNGAIISGVVTAPTPIVSETVGGFVGLHAIEVTPVNLFAPVEMGPLPAPEGDGFVPFIDPAMKNFLEIRNSASSNYRIEASGHIGGVVGEGDPFTRIQIDNTQIQSLMLKQTGGIAGGMVGSAERVKLKAGKTSGVISVEGNGASAGGVVGDVGELIADDMKASISVGKSNPSFTGEVGVVGGFAAMIIGDGKLTKIKGEALVKGCLTTGGLIGTTGIFARISIDQSYVNMKVDNSGCVISNFAARVTAVSGGIIGEVQSPMEAIGGFVGRSNTSLLDHMVITNSFVSADVIGNQSALPVPLPVGGLGPVSYLGGFVGWGNASVSKSYYSGKLKGHQILGGIFGRSKSHDVPIHNVFVNITTPAFDLKVQNTLRYYEGHYANSLNDLRESVHVLNASAVPSSGSGVSSVSLAQRNQQSNFLDFDFTNIWNPPGVNPPSLRGPFTY